VCVCARARVHSTLSQRTQTTLLCFRSHSRFAVLFLRVQDTFPKWPTRDLAAEIPGVEDTGYDLMAQMLVYAPSQRISAKSAMQHPYFS
jgi:hypothetical protein